MDYRKTFFLVLAFALPLIPILAQADQLAPNPNPAGHTITIGFLPSLNDLDFWNYGTINIEATPLPGSLTNRNKLTNYGDSASLNIYGSFTNALGARFDNKSGLAPGVNIGASGGLGNYGYITNDSNASLVNAGTITNYAGGSFVHGPPIHEPKKGVKLGDTFG